MDAKTLNILEQVTRLYKRYGIKSVTMDDVASHLCISKKTLYEHFKDKEDLVRNIVLLDYNKRNKFFLEIKRKNLNAIEELFEVYRMINSMFRDYNASMEYDIHKYYPDLFSKVKDIRRKQMFETMYSNMNKGKREGLYRKDLNSRIIARLHVFKVENMFDNEIFTMEELSSIKVFNEVFVYHMQGIMNEMGRSFFDANFARLKADLG
ncbi:MAG: TetR/AcrR family transcriptional regulator [Bacteroidetes bacterium]|nr:TetR/AcrR family transcriptional regulator [Bacteroidota bacterium]